VQYKIEQARGALIVVQKTSIGLVRIYRRNNNNNNNNNNLICIAPVCAKKTSVALA